MHPWYHPNCVFSYAAFACVNAAATFRSSRKAFRVAVNPMRKCLSPAFPFCAHLTSSFSPVIAVISIFTRILNIINPFAVLSSGCWETPGKNLQKHHTLRQTAPANTSAPYRTKTAYAVDMRKSAGMQGGCLFLQILLQIFLHQFSYFLLCIRINASSSK